MCWYVGMICKLYSATQYELVLKSYLFKEAAEGPHISAAPAIPSITTCLQGRETSVPLAS